MEMFIRRLLDTENLRFSLRIIIKDAELGNSHQFTGAFFSCGDIPVQLRRYLKFHGIFPAAQNVRREYSLALRKAIKNYLDIGGFRKCRKRTGLRIRTIAGVY